MDRLDPLRLGLAGGILWSAAVLILSLTALTGYGLEVVQLLQSVYLGYSLAPFGVVVGLVYAFLDGFIGLWLLAMLYNRLGKAS